MAHRCGFGGGAATCGEPRGELRVRPLRGCKTWLCWLAMSAEEEAAADWSGKEAAGRRERTESALALPVSAVSGNVPQAPAPGPIFTVLLELEPSAAGLDCSAAGSAALHAPGVAWSVLAALSVLEKLSLTGVLVARPQVGDVPPEAEVEQVTLQQPDRG